MSNEILPNPISDPEFADSLADKTKVNFHPKYSKGADLVEGIESEVAFVLKVSDAFDKAAGSGIKRAHLLLDIDNTIGAYNKDWEKYEDRRFIIRPAFIKLIEGLKKNSANKNIEFDLGFISNRESSHSQEQLSPGGQFQDFSGYVNKNLIFSSRHQNASDNIEYGEEKEFLSKLGIIDEHSPSLKRLPEMNPDGYDKLELLSELAKSKQRDEAYIVVDDSPVYPLLLDERKGFYGVELRDTGYFATSI